MRDRDESQTAVEWEVRRYIVFFIETWEIVKNCVIHSQRGRVFRMRDLYMGLRVLKGKKGTAYWKHNSGKKQTRTQGQMHVIRSPEH